jgi:hypothetical protein
VDGLLTRRRAEGLDAALSGPPPTEATLPRQRGDLAAQLAAVARLRDAGAALDPVPGEDFRAALRTRLLAVAAVQGMGAATASPRPAAVSWRQRASTVAAGVTAGVVAVTGVAVASSQSLPGDPFYEVKRTTESLQLRLADGGREEGERHLQFAAARLAEAHELAAGGSLSDDDERRVLQTLADMDADTRAASRLLTEDFRSSREPGALELLSRFAQEQRSGLEALLPALDGAADAAARDSLALVADVGTQADELLVLVDCTTACDPTAGAPRLPQAVPGAPGAPASSPPCACPTPAPAPSVAPPPTAPATGPTSPSSPAPSSPAGSPAPAPPQPPGAPGSPPPASSPAPPGGPPPVPSVPGVPLPPLPLPDPPLPTLPPLVDPLGPVPVPPLSGAGGVLDGLVGALPAVAPRLLAGGPAAVAVTWLQRLL